MPKPAPVLDLVTRGLLDELAANLPKPISGEQLLRDYLRLRVQGALLDRDARERLASDHAEHGFTRSTVRDTLMQAVDEALGGAMDVNPDSARALALVAESWRLEAEGDISSPCSPGLHPPGLDARTPWISDDATLFQEDDADKGTATPLGPTRPSLIRALYPLARPLPRGRPVGGGSGGRPRLGRRLGQHSIFAGRGVLPCPHAPLSLRLDGVGVRPIRRGARGMPCSAAERGGSLGAKHGPGVGAARVASTPDAEGFLSGGCPGALAGPGADLPGGTTSGPHDVVPHAHQCPA